MSATKTVTADGDIVFIQGGSVVSTVRADETVTVGSGGDFATINAALIALSAKYPLYKSGGYTAEISLLTGFVMAEQVFINGVDLSWITITSVDATVTVTRSAITETARSGGIPVFSIEDGKSPSIDVLFVIDATGTATNRMGMNVDNGQARIETGGGFRDAPYSGLFATEASIVNAEGADFDGCAFVAVYALKASTINADAAVVTSATTNGIRAEKGSNINCNGANATGAGTGFNVTDGSTLEATGVTGTLSQTANTVTGNGIIFQ